MMLLIDTFNMFLVLYEECSRWSKFKLTYYWSDLKINTKKKILFGGISTFYVPTHYIIKQ